MCGPQYSCPLCASGPTASTLRSTICARTDEPDMAQRIWDSSGFYACTDSASPSQDSAADGHHGQELYRTALLELAPEKLKERAKAADEAIHARASFNGEILSDA